MLKKILTMLTAFIKIAVYCIWGICFAVFSLFILNNDICITK